MTSQTTYHRTIVPIFLVCAWCFHFIYPVYYALGISSVRSHQQKRVQQRRRGDKEYTFHLTKANFLNAAREESRELELNGVRYDIRSIRIEGDIVHCIAIRDTEETALNKAYSKTVEQGGAVKKPNPLSYCWTVIPLDIPDYREAKSSPEQSSQKHSFYSFAECTGYMGLLWKPPTRFQHLYS